MSRANPILSATDLEVSFGDLKPVDGVSLALRKGETLGLVGESGCGKSMTALALMNLLPNPGTVSAGEILFEGENIVAWPEQQRRNLRGNRIAMIFQDPSAAFNPVFTIGDQIAEALTAHDRMFGHEAWSEAIRLLGEVGISEPEKRAAAYPHEFSGGMLQRAMTAMALACEPDVLIADEPTTALDVTVQAQILELLEQLQERHGMAMLFISHNLAVVSQIADRIAVMYAGKIVEMGETQRVLAQPCHPYTSALINTVPKPSFKGRLPTIEGTVPPLHAFGAGCRFAGRCPLADQHCTEQEPALRKLDNRQSFACFKELSA